MAIAIKPLHEIAWHTLQDDQVLKQLDTSIEGISSEEATRRLQE